MAQSLPYFVILAGGSGTRLWPLSRSSYPKHLLDLEGKGSMVQQTVSRILPMTTPDHILVVTEKTHAGALIKQLPTIPQKNILIEPERRETAPVLAFAVAHIALRDPEACMIALPADHYVGNPLKFRSTIKAAVNVADKMSSFVTLGVFPHYPATGYGYIACGKTLGKMGSHSYFAVDQFTEKPNLATAQAFLASGKYLWNSGIFLWKASTFLRELQLHQPQMYATTIALQKAIAKKKSYTTIYKHYHKISVDYALLEKVEQVVMVPADFGWSDIGDWKSVQEILANYPEENVSRGTSLPIGSSGSLLYSPQKLIVTIGLDDLIVVDTPDVLLICPKSRSQDVKLAVKELGKVKKMRKYL